MKRYLLRSSKTLLSQIKKIPGLIHDERYFLVFLITGIILLYGISPELRFDLLLENPNYNPPMLLPNYILIIDGLVCLVCFSMLMPRCNF